MNRSRLSRRTMRSLKRTGFLLLLFSLLLFVVFPVCLHYSSSLQLFLIFRHKPLRGLLAFESSLKDLSRPEDYGLPGTFNFYLRTEADTSVGVWHILPESLIYVAPDNNSPRRTVWFQESLRKGKPIFLYLHGNAYSREKDYRLGLYRLLRSRDYHVITMDYRGYGESQAEPSEEGLVTDAKAVYKYLETFAGDSSIYVYGHSLGTGVACHVVADFCAIGHCPKGLILQSPFNNLASAVRANKLSQMLTFIPYFDWSIIKPLQEKNITFENDKHISKIPIHILILHGRDDDVIPFTLGEKLYEAAKNKRPRNSAPVIIDDLDGKKGYKHNFIYKLERLPVTIENFVKEAEMAGE